MPWPSATTDPRTLYSTDPAQTLSLCIGDDDWFKITAPSNSWIVGTLNYNPAVSELGLGLYNFIRFGNPLETGLTYQLTIPEFSGITYSLSYIPSNLYVYLVYPLTGSATFPFIQSAHFRPALLEFSDDVLPEEPIAPGHHYRFVPPERSAIRPVAAHHQSFLSHWTMNCALRYRLSVPPLINPCSSASVTWPSRSIKSSRP